VEEFIQALRAHAAAIEHLATPGAAPESVDPAIDALQAAALAYDEAVFERTGLADVFDDLVELVDEFDAYWDDGAAPDDDALVDDVLVVEPNVQRLSLQGQWDFLIRDPKALQDLAEQRLREEIPEIDAETLDKYAGSPVAALSTLLGHDGMVDYGGLEEAGARWSVGLTDKTLAEMTSEDDPF
jgi:hypothetical protein